MFSLVKPHVVYQTIFRMSYEGALVTECFFVIEGKEKT